MLAGIYYGSQYGGSTTSILLRIPGEAASVMTCIDGHAMAKKGRAGAALCIAAVGSFIAGTFGVDRAHLGRAAACELRAALRPARICRAAGAGPHLPRLHVHHVAHSNVADGVVRTAARHHRHRRHDRAFPLQLRHTRARATASASYRWRSGCSASARFWRRPAARWWPTSCARNCASCGRPREEWRLGRCRSRAVRCSAFWSASFPAPPTSFQASSPTHWSGGSRSIPRSSGSGAVAGVAGPEVRQ